MTDVIERHVHLKATPEKVWSALTDHTAFGTWFRVALDGPFAVGEAATGVMTYPGHEGAPFHATVVAMEPLTRFAYTWVPGAGDPADAAEPQTLVEFLLAPDGAGGTHLTVRESGFERLRAGERDEAMRGNTRGWEAQLGNIARHVGVAAPEVLAGPAG